jgi:hypothetical protein
MKFNELYKLVTEEDFFSEDIQKFREVYDSPKSVLFETPIHTGNYGGGFNQPPLNKIRTDRVKKDDHYIKDIIYAENVFKLYRGEKNGLIEDSLIWEDRLFSMYAYYKHLKDGGIEIDSSWNHFEMEGLFRFYFWTELFPNYKYIQSSYTNSTQAMNFWIKICKEANEKGYTFSVKSLSNEWEEIYKDYKKLEKDKDEIWNNYSGDLRLRVYK